MAFLHRSAFAPSRWFPRILCFFHLRYYEFEGFGDIDIQPGAGFDEPTIKFFSQFGSITRSHLPLLRPQIVLLANNDQWNPISTLRKRQT